MSNGISDEAIVAYAADLIDLEGRINELQDDKKATYASVRDAFGKRTADALKLAIKRYRMDADKREAADEVDAEADRFLSLIRSPRAPRATRTREIIEEIPPHDADGVILETSSPTTNGGDNETSEHSELVNLGRRQFRDRAAEGANADEHQHPQPAATHIAPTESAADEISAPIPQPAEGVTPTSAGHGDESAVLPSAALVVADRTKPNPICQDPEDCGIEASWNHVCGSCLRRRAHVEAAGAVQ